MTTLEYLTNRYGGKPHLTVADLADFMGMSDKSVQNAISADRFPIRTAKKGKFRVADVRDVADWWDKQRTSA
ncbi:hypothetical protein [Primorskyibacter sedentarius]|uniref:hypothetical protein n=1 Tax=Primorskyibacter sedentarius TaxID=745311 RepID=UPI003EBB81C3